MGGIMDDEITNSEQHWLDRYYNIYCECDDFNAVAV